MNNTLKIKNYINNRPLQILLFNTEDKLIKIIDISNKNDDINKINSIDFELDQVKKIIFKSNRLKSETIYLSEFTPNLSVKFVFATNSLKVDFISIPNRKNGIVYSKTFKSEKLKYRHKKINTFIYEQKKKKNEKYHLIIAFDGQNLFSKYGTNNYTQNNDGYGGWQLDQVLNQVYSKTRTPFLVVSIDNATKYRDKELTMSQEFGLVIKYILKMNKVFGKGSLESLADFIINDLLDYIKSNYDVNLSDVGILGSSSGGLASFYMGLKYSDVFKYILSFSPAILFYHPDALNKLIINNENLPKLYITGGYKSSLERNITDFIDVYSMYLSQIYPKEKLLIRIDENYDHNELQWRFLLPEAFDFALKK